MSDDIDLTIPEFLQSRRPRLTDEQARALTGAQIRWAPFRRPEDYREERKAATMAKLNIHVENRDAPVEVSYQEGKDDYRLLRRLENMDAFEAWYKPAYDCRRVVSTPDVTILLAHAPKFLLGLGDAAKERPSRASRAARPLRPPRTVTTPKDGAARVVKGPSPGSARTGRYVDSRHVTLMAEAGWTFDAGTPNTFARKGVTVVIAPPTSGRWSSSWTLPDGRTGRGVATLLKAVL